MYKPRVQHVLSMGTRTDDFNCWGATQFIAQATPTLKWVDHNTMGRWLADNYSPVRKSHVREGDIVALFDEDMHLIHTAYYIGGGKYVHKLGRNVARLESLNKVLASYQRETKKYIFLRKEAKCV